MAVDRPSTDAPVPARVATRVATRLMGAPLEISPLTRRQFVVASATLAGSTALAAGSLLSLAGCAGAPSAVPATPNRWIALSTAGLTTGEPRWIEFDTSLDATGARPTPAGTPADSLPASRGGAWLVLEADGSVVAFVPYCTHQLCFFDWESGSARFRCRCHDASFDIDGAVVSGPPPRPLWRYETRASGTDTIEIGWVDKA